MNTTAQQIYQANLDAGSAALMAGDTRAAIDHIAIPNMMATLDCEIVIASPEEFDIVLQDFRQKLLDMGADRYRRICTEADFVPGMADMIAGRHRTEITLKDGRAIPAYENRMVLLRIDGQWKGIWLQTLLSNHEIEILSPDIAEAQAKAHRGLEASGQAASATPPHPEGRDKT